MAFNGAGVFRRLYSWQADRAAHVKGSSTKMDAEEDGITTGLSGVICKDAQTTLSVAIPFAAGLKLPKNTAAVQFADDTDTGFYGATADTVVMVAGAAGPAFFFNGSVLVTGDLNISGSLIRSGTGGDSCGVVTAGASTIKGDETPVLLNFATEVFDTAGMHNDANNGRITFTRAGVYLITGCFVWSSSISNTGEQATSIRIKRNGSSYLAENGSNFSHSTAKLFSESTTVSTIYTAAVNDYVELEFRASFSDWLDPGQWSGTFGAALIA